MDRDKTLRPATVERSIDLLNMPPNMQVSTYGAVGFTSNLAGSLDALRAE